MVDLKGLYKVKAKGRTYYYAWRNGPRIEAAFGTPAFVEEFLALRNPIAKADKRRFSAWVSLYRNSDDFKDLADNTKRVWLPWLDRIKEEFGELRTAQFDRPGIIMDVKRWLAGWKDRPRAADTGKQVLSRLLSFIQGEGYLSINICEHVANVYDSDRSDLIWDEDSLKVLLKDASQEVTWAVRLAMYTGLRQADLMRLSWTHIKANHIEIPTNKSRKGKKKVSRKVALIPIIAPLRAVLDGIPKRALHVLTNSRGQPWKAFGTSWNDLMHDSGLAAQTPRLHFHDFRGTAATNFYRADLTIREIAEILTWSEDRVEKLIDKYVKRDELMRDRIRRIEASKSFESGD